MQINFVTCGIIFGCFLTTTIEEERSTQKISAEKSAGIVTTFLPSSDWVNILATLLGLAWNSFS